MTKVRKAVLGRPSTLNREDIVDCAMKLLDKNGVEAMTLRGIARELGCVLGTINYYFKNLADLEDAIIARLTGQLPALDVSRAEPIREQLVELGLAMIRVHSTHPYLRQVAGPISIEISARHLRKSWATLQDLGLPERLATLCMEVISGIAHNQGTQIYRLRNGSERVLQLYEDFARKLGKAPASKITASNFTVKAVEPLHREMLSNAVDIFLRGSGIEEKAKGRGNARKPK